MRVAVALNAAVVRIPRRMYLMWLEHGLLGPQVQDAGPIRHRRGTLYFDAASAAFSFWEKHHDLNDWKQFSTARFKNQ